MRPSGRAYGNRRYGVQRPQMPGHSTQLAFQLLAVAATTASVVHNAQMSHGHNYTPNAPPIYHRGGGRGGGRGGSRYRGSGARRGGHLPMSNNSGAGGTSGSVATSTQTQSTGANTPTVQQVSAPQGGQQAIEAPAQNEAQNNNQQISNMSLNEPDLSVVCASIEPLNESELQSLVQDMIQADKQ